MANAQCFESSTKFSDECWKMFSCVFKPRNFTSSLNQNFGVNEMDSGYCGKITKAIIVEYISSCTFFDQ